MIPPPLRAPTPPQRVPSAMAPQPLVDPELFDIEDSGASEAEEILWVDEDPADRSKKSP